MALLLVIATATLLHWPTALQLHELWTDTDGTTYTHGYLIAAVSVWLLWQRRTAIQAAVIDPAWAAIVALSAAELAWLVAFQAGIQLATLLLLPAILWLLVLCTLGRGMARQTCFPFGYLYFAIPVWGLFNPPAQWTTVYAVRLMLSAVGIDAFFEANRVQLQSGTFEIAGGCSGLHFIMVGLSLAALVGELRQDGMRMRLKLAGLALLLAVLTNWVRVFVIIVAGDMTHMQHYLVKVSHYGFGWTVFAVAMAVFFLMESRLQPDIQTKAPNHVESHSAIRSRAPIWLTTTLIVALPTVTSALIKNRQQHLSVSLPARVGDWPQMATSTGDAWSPVFVGADAEVRAAYTLNNDSVEVFSAWYATQLPGKKLGGYYNTVFGELAADDEQSAETLGGRSFNVSRARGKDGQTSALWYSYQVGERWFRSPVRAQLWYAAQAIARLRPPVSRVLALRAGCISGCARADQSISGLLQQWK